MNSVTSTNFKVIHTAAGVEDAMEGGCINLSDAMLDRLQLATEEEGSVNGMQYEQWCLRLQRMREVGAINDKESCLYFLF